MKQLGTLLLAIGVVVCASAGIQLGDREFATAVDEARVALQARPTAPSAAAPVTPGERLTQWYSVAGLPFVAGFLLLLAGAIMARVAISRDGAAATGEAQGVVAADLERLISGVREAGALLQRDGVDAAVVQERIEQLQREQLEPMIEARGALQRRLGLAGYAAVVSPLSGAERFLNRAWSALVDGHSEECSASLAAAAAEAEVAAEALESAENAR